jgi:thiaminase
MTFIDELDTQHADLWRSYRHHPWIEAMADGTLTTAQFVAFQVNDAPYISDLHRCLALGLSKAPVGGPWSKAATTVLDDVWILGEIRAKQDLLGELGWTEPLPIGPEAYTPAREAYANHLVRASLEGGFGEVAAALLPCAMFTQVIGERFRGVAIPGPRAFQTWADIYVQRAVHRMAEMHARAVNDEAARTDDRGRDRMRLLYVRSIQHQIDVFDEAYEQSGQWPGQQPTAQHAFSSVG